MSSQIKIAHEAPFEMMPFVQNLTDYDYALVHLFDEQYTHDAELSDKYFQFFKDALKNGRQVILDNSIFELGEAFSFDAFLEWVVRLNPTYFVIPDALDDVRTTVARIRRWNELESKLRDDSVCTSHSIGVVQGENYDELDECFAVAYECCNVIALSFDSIGYGQNDFLKKHFDLFTQEQYRAIGRRLYLDHLIDIGYVGPAAHVHLLGCATPQEFAIYARDRDRYSCVKSIDTSNPVMKGIVEGAYGDMKTMKKIPTKVVDVFRHSFDINQYFKVAENIRMFRNLVKGE